MQLVHMPALPKQRAFVPVYKAGLSFSSRHFLRFIHAPFQNTAAAFCFFPGPAADSDTPHWDIRLTCKPHLLPSSGAVETDRTNNQELPGTGLALLAMPFQQHHALPASLVR